MELSIDAGRCIGCGMCAAAVPEVFHVGGSGVHGAGRAGDRNGSSG